MSDPEEHQESNGPETGARPGAFATTRWTVVVAAGQAGDAPSKMAMEELCRVYWYPLYAYVRRRGYSKEDAEDLTQAFLARLFAGKDLEGLSPERGRFRAFLLASLKNHLANEWDKSQRLKRGGGVTFLPLGCDAAEQRYRVEPSHHLSPDKLYDRVWAITLLERVLEKLAEANSGNPAFASLKPCLTVARQEMDYPAVAAELGMSEGAVRVAVHRLRKQYREYLKAEIAGTLAGPEQLDDELQALHAAFSG
jgi:RNA polymerase sigma factor (sigma-70 family)